MDGKQKFVLILVLLLVVATAGLFIYINFFSKKVVTPPPASPTPGQLPYNPYKDDETQVKEIAENFVSLYGSYESGNFKTLRNAESLMTESYKEETEKFIAAKEEEAKKQPKQYLMVNSTPKETNIISLDQTNATVTVDFDSSTTHGAYIYNGGVLVALDEAGKKTTAPLKQEQARKKATLTMIREKGYWKVKKINIE